MVAYLLCAGFGTRMQPLTRETPKSLLSVGGRPFLDHLVDAIRSWLTLDAIHLAVNHRDADSFRTWAARWRSSLSTGVALQVHDDEVYSPDEQLGAVGDLQFLLDETGLPADGALVTGGDSLYRFPLTPILNAFAGKTAHVLALYQSNESLRRQSSVLHLDGNRVTAVSEAPIHSESTRICPSWYLFPSSALAKVGPYLSDGHDPDTLGRFVDALAHKQWVNAVQLPKHPNLRLHCNTPEDLDRANALLNTGPYHAIDEEAVRQCVIR